MLHVHKEYTYQIDLTAGANKFVILNISHKVLEDSNSYSNQI